MDNNSSSGTGRILILIAGMILTALVMAGVGFVIGRASAQPQTVTEVVTEIVTEAVEVTREVLIVTTPSPAPIVETAVSPESTVPSQPTPLPTAPTAPIRSDFDPEAIDLGAFYQAWQIIGEEFDGPVPADEDLVYSAISGSIKSLDDDFTRFFPPDIAARMREDMSGSISGIGATVRENDDGLIEIIRPFDGQPADLVGLLPGDLIIEVDGESVVGFDFEEALLNIRGPQGTTVMLGIMRENEPEMLSFEIVRATFEVPVVESKLIERDGRRIAYVWLTTFNRAAETAVLDALNDLLSQNPDGIILDLRDNGGGFLDQSVAVADIFLPESVVLFERNNRGLEETFRADDGDRGESLPLVVLVNAGSASASEIVAGAIQDNQRGILIGETTFGKGSVQQVHTLADGSELRVTIARWYTPDNNTIDKEGITPDIEIESPPDLGGEADQQLQRAIEFLLNQEG